jgi:hypothetical protein
LQGVDALRERYESELAAPDLTIECKQLLVDEGAQTLAAENLERGTHSGDLVVGGERLSPTGRRLELRGGLFIAAPDPATQRLGVSAPASERDREVVVPGLVVA